MYSIPGIHVWSQVSTRSSRPASRQICWRGYAVRYPPRLSSILCAIECQDAKSRLRGAVWEDVLSCNRKSSDRTGLAVPLSTAIHDVIQEPSDEYFSMRPVFGYATNAEPSLRDRDGQWPLVC